MDYKIHPLKGVGAIAFGMSPQHVRVCVGEEFQSFKRSPQASFPCDYFKTAGAFFYYDPEGRLEAVEFAAPARPAVGGVKLLGLTFEAANAALATLDDRLENQIDTTIAFQLGVSIYAPLAKDDPSAPVETMLAFRAGYYD